MTKLILTPSRSLKQFRLLPGKTKVGNVMSKISLKTKLCKRPKKDDHIFINLPLLSAAMQAVTGREMAIALAQLGGLGVIPCSLNIEDQVEIIKNVKRYKSGFQEKVITVSKDDKISKIMKMIKEKGYGKFPVTVNGKQKGKFLGIITSKNFDPKVHASDPVKDHMVGKVVTGIEGISLGDANREMVKYGVDVLPVLDKKGNLSSVVFKKDMQKHLHYPDASVDDYKRYMVGAAVSTQPSDKERIDAIIKADVDMIFIDASDGYSQFQVDTLEYIRKKNKNIPVIGGNIVHAEAFNMMAEAGFDAVKVGMGIGSGCTTQAQKGTGRGMATTIIDVSGARDEFNNKTGKYLPIIADGSVSNSGQMMIALALGADAVMMGSFFAGFTESAGGLRQHPTMGPLKEYWMEASARAKSYGRYNATESTFFEEGVEGFVPHVGSLYTNLGETILKMKSSMSSCGCKNMDELHEKAVVELQSEIAVNDAGVHDIITK